MTCGDYDGLTIMADCVDLHGRAIAPGFHFVPGPDTCTLCICDNGNPKWCKAVLCSPPQDCKSFRVGNSCCEFICLDETLGKGDAEHDFNTDLGLRLIATAITAILSLSLLFFLIHRLRQRKIRGRQNRELSEEERSLGSIGYIAGSLAYLAEPHFEEPSAHYPLWKPAGSYYTGGGGGGGRGEAPPPYEEAVAAARAEAALSTRNIPGPSVASQLASHHRTIPVNLATSGALVGGGGVPTIVQSAPVVVTAPAPPASLQPPTQPQPAVATVIHHQQLHPTSSLIHYQPLPVVNSRSVSERVSHLEELDDYRSECENCNISAQQLNGSGGGSGAGLDYQEDLQTMTLHRRVQEGADQQPFYRTSLTLPTQCRKHRCNGIHNGVTMSCARDNWFNNIPASSSSEEEEE